MILVLEPYSTCIKGIQINIPIVIYAFKRKWLEQGAQLHSVCTKLNMFLFFMCGAYISKMLRD